MNEARAAERAGFPHRVLPAIPTRPIATPARPAYPERGPGSARRHRRGAVLRIDDRRYRLVAKRHGGIMSQVWQGVDELSDVPVAVKIAARHRVPTLDTVTLTPLRALSRHPSIVTCFAHGTRDGWFYQILEWLDGEPVSRAPAGAVRATRLTWLHQIANAIARLHAAGFVHGDIKPDNILVVDGRARLIDIVGLRAGDPWHRRGGLTPDFASAAARDGAAADPGDDLHAFALTAWCVLTGQRLPPDGPIGWHAVPDGISGAEWRRLRDACRGPAHRARRGVSGSR